MNTSSTSSSPIKLKKAQNKQGLQIDLAMKLHGTMNDYIVLIPSIQLHKATCYLLSPPNYLILYTLRSGHVVLNTFKEKEDSMTSRQLISVWRPSQWKTVYDVLWTQRCKTTEMADSEPNNHVTFQGSQVKRILLSHTYGGCKAVGFWPPWNNYWILIKH